MSSAPSARRRSIRLGLAGVAVAAAAACVAWPALVEPLAYRQFATDYRACQAVPLGVHAEEATSPLERLFSFVPASLVARLGDHLHTPLVDLRVRELQFDTRGPSGAPQPVKALLFEPPDVDDDGITLHLLSSGPAHPWQVEVESMAFVLSFDPPRRVLCLPLPVYEQRGEPWPALANVDLTGYRAIARQLALDARRAVDACRSFGWRVTGLSGYSLGGCLAVGVAAAHPEAFAEAELRLWGAGGDLPLLIRTSDHWLVKRLARPPRMSARGHAAALRVLDPVRQVRRARARSLTLIAGRHDQVIPYACAEALRDAAQRAGMTVELIDDDGGHWRGPGLLGLLRQWVPRPAR
ncbi:MAG: hypothetical protein HYU66_17315 [Armatimonadetes bacterium]|nr:hypothetical protein [Armatimonadota bacterium]